MGKNIKRTYVQILTVLIFFGIFSFPIIAQDLVPIPELTDPVVDKIGLIEKNTKEKIESKIYQLQKEKGSQIQVLILNSTQPESIEQYSIRLAEKWKIGRKDIDDGIILIVAKQDRKLRIEVGYGLEGAVPDAIANRIIDQIITPQFKQGNYSTGIESGVDALIQIIRGEELAETDYTNVDEYKTSSSNGVSGFVYIIAIVVGLIFRALGMGLFVFLSMFIILLVSSLLSGGGFLDGVWHGAVFSAIATAVLFGRGGGSGGYSSGGGFSSGGGGWSGGGGSFGGGGSSGSW